MSKHFKTVCTVDSLKPGQMQRFCTANSAILLANIKGIFFAVEDLCSHEDISLYLGCMRGENIECSLHGGTFNLKTGLAVKEPAEQALQTFVVKVIAGDVQVEAKW
jgi:nitrite reductase/ring-hydroxylating ferredoxin subunit